MGRIGFNQVPANARVPFAYIEFDPSKAAASDVAFRSLLIGQKLATGAAAAAVPVSVATVAVAEAQFGRGSMLAEMVAAYRRTDRSGDLWCVALDDNGGGTAEVRTITLTGPATDAGSLNVYVNGRRLQVAVSNGDAANAIADALKKQFDETTDLPVTASVNNAVVTVTHRHKGAATDLDLRHSYRAGESLPAGVTCVFAIGAPGAGDPDVQTALDGLGDDDQYNVIATPYSDDPSMDKIEADLAERWGPVAQSDGQAIAAYKGATGTPGEATTYGNARNSLHSTVMDAGGMPTPNYVIAADVAGAVAASARIDPARPFQTLVMKSTLPPALGSARRGWTERNTLLHDGMSTYSVDAADTVRIERLITTYQTRNGAPDSAYLNLNTPMTLSYIRADFRNYMQSKYARHKLADNGTRVGEGQPVMTPALGRAEAIARFEEWERRGLVEGADQFAEDLVVERNADNRDRLDFLMSPDLVNQLRVLGVQMAFIL